jgi:hypothetical protein
MVKTSVSYCVGCGQQLTGGRYCPRCSGKKGMAARWLQQRLARKSRARVKEIKGEHDKYLQRDAE